MTAASSTYECSVCLFTGPRTSCELHYIINHVSDDQVPWRCSLCGFKNISESALGKHLKFDVHKKALKKKPNDFTVFMKSQKPYRVEIGKDIVLTREDRPNYSNTRSSQNHNQHRISSRRKGNAMKRQSSFEPVYEESPTKRLNSFEPVYSPTKRQSLYQPFHKSGQHCSPQKGIERPKDRPQSPVRNRRRKGRWDNPNSKARRFEDDTSIINDDVGKSKTLKKTCAEAHSTTNIQPEPVSDGADDAVGWGIQGSSVVETVDTLMRETRVTGSSTQSGFWYGFEPTEDVFNKWTHSHGKTEDQTKILFEPRPISFKSDVTATLRPTALGRTVAAKSDYNEIEPKSNGELADRQMSAHCSRSTSVNETDFVQQMTFKQSTETQTDPCPRDIEPHSSHVRADDHWPRTPSEDNTVKAEQDDEFDEEGLEDKVSELVQALEPLKNISKALIALDHHLRRVVPLLETVVSRGQHVASATVAATTTNITTRVNSDPRLRVRTEL